MTTNPNRKIKTPKKSARTLRESIIRQHKKDFMKEMRKLIKKRMKEIEKRGK